jgi:hypothetical protein
VLDYALEDKEFYNLAVEKNMLFTSDSANGREQTKTHP